MRPRYLPTGAAVTATLLCAAAVGLSAWVDARLPESGAGVLSDAIGPVYAATGALLVHLRPRNSIGWLLVLTGLLGALSSTAVAYGGYGTRVADPAWPLAAVIAQAGSMAWLPAALLPATVLVAVYPSGRLPARWWRWPVGAVVSGLLVVTVLSSLSQSSYDDFASGTAPVLLPEAGWVVGAGVVAGLAIAAGTLTIWAATVLRLARARSPERQQLAWLLCVVLPLMVAIFFIPSPWVWLPLAMMVPGSILIGVVRYRLLGIVVSRALVYAALTAAVVVLYLAVATVTAAALGRTLSAVPAAVAAALIAVALGPARGRLQAAADRLVYGRRRDPVGAVTELGDRVATAEEADLLPAALGSVTAALRAPGAVVTRPGDPPTEEGGTVAMPLRVGGRDVGTLHVTERHPGEPFTAGDLRLLAALAPQVAVVVRALELAGWLERERDRVLTATHAERDRIRRDLHDGLGPSLAGIGLGVQAVQAHLDGRADDPTATLLARLKDEVDAAVGEVRRIIDGLRPQPLDDVGFVAAVRRHAEALAPSVPVRVTAEELPPLPPDVETAAYRIAQEALTNVARHAGARSADVELRARDGRLEVSVGDDGTGFGTAEADGPRPGGVGLDSMRIRAQAVGGALTVTSGPGGTRVVAGLPLEAR
ncbi:histidine kinase/DNA gyrase B/HSP90-like ATPase [Blastococcus colisei]|uniref:histidine kinase n=1 Tax=Blastococcus colisei TaxID=1564162 RepID=A0A543P234_9ACTN|nr:histidine kinase [Blastococcus colisei]TQN38073.1 histidine kinase/DNA gyrase B/HSP90-like ATPase [Blastococcus colisei]